MYFLDSYNEFLLQLIQLIVANNMAQISSSYAFKGFQKFSFSRKPEINFGEDLKLGVISKFHESAISS